MSLNSKNLIYFHDVSRKSGQMRCENSSLKKIINFGDLGVFKFISVFFKLSRLLMKNLVYKTA